MSIYILGSIVGILIKDMFLINVLAIVLCNVTVLLLIGKGVEIYEKNLKDNIYKLIIKSCFAMAFLAAGSASYWGGYQQKEPEHLDEY